MHLKQNKNAFILFLSDFWSVRCKHCTCIFSFHCIWFTRVYMPQIFCSLFGVFFCSLHLTMFQDSFLICLTFGVKCKPWQATDLVLMSSSDRFWECLWTTVPSVCFLCLCHSLSFRVFNSLFHSCTKKSMCACMSLCVKP